MSTLIYGLGNPILTDDSIGLRIAGRLRDRLEGVDVKEAAVAGIAILDDIAGYRRLVVIDSIKTRGGSPGSLYRLSIEDLDRADRGSRSHHGLGLGHTLEIGRKMGYILPEEIMIYAIEVDNNTDFSEQLSPTMASVLDGLVDTIESEIAARLAEDGDAGEGIER